MKSSLHLFSFRQGAATEGRSCVSIHTLLIPIAVNDPATVCAKVDATEDPQITGDRGITRATFAQTRMQVTLPASTRRARDTQPFEVFSTYFPPMLPSGGRAL